MSKESARAQAAYEGYQGMGPARSIEKLFRKLSDSDPDCPSLSGLKYFSREHRWVERVREYDKTVAETVQERAIEAEVEKRVDALGAVDVLIVSCSKILEQLDQNTPLAIHTPQDLRAVATSLDVAAKLKELLEGRATERTSKMSIEEVKQHLEAALAERDAIIAREDAQQDTLH